MGHSTRDRITALSAHKKQELCVQVNRRCFLFLFYYIFKRAVMQLHLLSRSWMVPHSSHWHPVRQHERQGLIRTRKTRKLKKPREEEEKRGEKREGECRREAVNCIGVKHGWASTATMMYICIEQPRNPTCSTPATTLQSCNS